MMLRGLKTPIGASNVRGRCVPGRGSRSASPQHRWDDKKSSELFSGFNHLVQTIECRQCHERRDRQTVRWCNLRDGEGEREVNEESSEAKALLSAPLGLHLVSHAYCCFICDAACFSKSTEMVNQKTTSEYRWKSCFVSSLYLIMSILVQARDLVNWTLWFPVQPRYDALLVKFAETLQPCELISWIILDHADRTFRRVSVVRNAVFFCGSEGQYA